MNSLGGWADRTQFVLSGALALALVVGVVITAIRSRYLRDLPRRELLLLGGCLGLALALRLAATTFVAATELESTQALAFGSGHRWGAGWSAVLSGLAQLGHVDVAAISRLNLALSVATVAALFVFVDSYFEDRFAAFAATAVLALQPISARYANSDSSAVLPTLCLVAGAAFLARWNGSGKRGLLLQGVGWLVLAPNVRYESVVYLVAGALLVVGGGGWPRRGRTRELLLAALVGALFLIYPVGRALLDASRGIFEMSVYGYVMVFVLSRHSPPPIVAVAFVGLLGAILARFRSAVGLLLALMVVSLPGWFLDKECSDSIHRYSLSHLALWAAFAGYGCSTIRDLLHRAIRRGRREPTAAAERGAGTSLLAVGVVVLLVAAAGAPYRSFLTRMWTHALEYEFVVAQLRKLPDDCLVVGPDSDAEGRGLRFSAALSGEAGRRHTWARSDSPEILAGRVPACAVYYRATTCHAYEYVLRPQSPDWVGAERPVCLRIGELYELEPIATTTIPSRPYICEGHTVDPIPAGFYRMRPKRGAGTPPPGPGPGGPP
jgi:hypothetical protein